MGYPLSSNNGKLVALDDFTKLASCWELTDEDADKPDDGGSPYYWFRRRRRPGAPSEEAFGGYLQGATVKPAVIPDEMCEWRWQIGDVPIPAGVGLHDVGAALATDCSQYGDCTRYPGSMTPNTNSLYYPNLGDCLKVEWNEARQCWLYGLQTWDHGGVEEISLYPDGSIYYHYLSGTADWAADPDTPDGRPIDHTGAMMVQFYAGGNYTQGGWGSSQWVDANNARRWLQMGYGGGTALRRVRPRAGGPVRFFGSGVDIPVTTAAPGAINTGVGLTWISCVMSIAPTLGWLSFDFLRGVPGGGDPC